MAGGLGGRARLGRLPRASLATAEVKSLSGHRLTAAGNAKGGPRYYVRIKEVLAAAMIERSIAWYDAALADAKMIRKGAAVLAQLQETPILSSDAPISAKASAISDASSLSGS